MTGPQRCPECGSPVGLTGAPGLPCTGAECTAAEECGWAGADSETDASPPRPAASSEPTHCPGQRPAEPGEYCTCGRQAVLVFTGGAHGDTGYCGLPDAGDRAGPCPFCGGGRHEGRRPAYRLRPEATR